MNLHTCCNSTRSNQQQQQVSGRRNRSNWQLGWKSFGLSDKGEAETNEQNVRPRLGTAADRLGLIVSWRFTSVSGFVS